MQAIIVIKTYLSLRNIGFGAVILNFIKTGIFSFKKYPDKANDDGLGLWNFKHSKEDWMFQDEESD